MKESKLPRIETILVIFLLYFCKTADRVKVSGSPIETPKTGSHEDPKTEVSTLWAEASRNRSNAKENQSKSDPGSIVNSTTQEIQDTDFNFFRPFIEFPFFPYSFPSHKRNAFHLNSSDETIQINGEGKARENPSILKPKSFLFIDFAFNLQKIPSSNQRMHLSSKESKAKSILEKNLRRELNGSPYKVPDSPRKDFISDYLNDDWSSAKKLPLFLPIMDEFFPKTDFLFFNLPFHKKRNKKSMRSRRTIKKRNAENSISVIRNVFQEAKKEMERLAQPFWVLDTDAARTTSYKNSKNRFQIRNSVKLIPKDYLTYKTAPYPMKQNRSEIIVHMNPVMMGKTRKIILGDNYLEKENQEILEKHKEFSSVDDQLKLKMGQKCKAVTEINNHNEDKFNKLREKNLPTEPRVVKNIKFEQYSEQIKTKTTANKLESSVKEKKANTTLTSQTKDKNQRILENGLTIKSWTTQITDIEFQNGNHVPEAMVPITKKLQLEVLNSSSAYRHPRMLKASADTDRKNTSKEDRKRNLLNALEKLFALMNKPEDLRKIRNQNKATVELNEISWSKLEEPKGAGFFENDGAGRSKRNDAQDHEEKYNLVPDLKYFFFAVTLPTLFALTLLLLVCVVTLKTRGLLCKRIFKPRNVYLVEGDPHETSAYNVEAQQRLNREIKD